MNNNYIDCDVANCRHNYLGKECSLIKVRITTDCSKCTCCDSFKSKDED